MKAIILAVVVLGWLALEAGANEPPYISTTYPHVVKTNMVTIQLEPLSEVPESVGVLVQGEDPMVVWQAKDKERMEKWRAELATNRNAQPGSMLPMPPQNQFASAHWVPFQTNLVVDLGPGAGNRMILLGFKYKGKPFDGSSSGYIVSIQDTPPHVVFTNPKQGIISQPMIQLQGYTTTDLEKPLTYQIFNQNGSVTATGEGLVNDRHLDPATFLFTTTYFTCYDLNLNPGTNTIVLRGEDTAGYSFSTNFVVVFTTAGDTNPPIFSIDSPEPNGEVSVDSLTIRGPSDDPTAKFSGQISVGGHTNDLSAVVERNGYFWFEHVPLANGVNQVTIVATDVAGNSSRTNFVIYGSNEVRVTMDPVLPADQLWQPTIKVVTGHVQPANHEVWINGVQAAVKPDGTWLAKKVPVLSSPSGGTALFNLTTLSPGDLAKGNVKVNDKLSTQASLGTNDIVLNASSPACGVFQLHLTETTGRSFILEASTNLVAWSPILTNTLSNPTFDYTDTNAGNYPCRFFRVVPLP